VRAAIHRGTQSRPQKVFDNGFPIGCPSASPSMGGDSSAFLRLAGGTLLGYQLQKFISDR
jgi:hypothetical protein